MNPLQDLLVEELQDLLHAEGQLVKALPKMAKASHAPELRQAFTTHLEETKQQVERLKQVFEMLGAKAKAKPCKGMAGLLEEGQETIEEKQEEPEAVADLALIAAAQKAEHYEISGYGTVRALAKQLGQTEVFQLLGQNEEEEKNTDKILTQLAKPLLKQVMTETAEEEEDGEE